MPPRLTNIPDVEPCKIRSVSRRVANKVCFGLQNLNTGHAAAVSHSLASGLVTLATFYCAAPPSLFKAADLSCGPPRLSGTIRLTFGETPLNNSQHAATIKSRIGARAETVPRAVQIIASTLRLRLDEALAADLTAEPLFGRSPRCTIMDGLSPPHRNDKKCP
jgi:hypothetical protein